MEIVTANGSNQLQEKVDASNKAPKGQTPLATASKGIDDYERDTDVSEELSSEKLMQLLLPDGCFPGSNSDKSNFFIAYSNDALSAWVKQRSPGCAAASVAGAWNALGGLKRQDKGARTMDDNIGVLKQIQQDRVNNTRGRIERLLGNVSIEPVLDATKKHLMDKHNKMIGGENKETSASKKLMKEAFTKVVFESFQIEYDADKTYLYTDPVFELLREDMEDPVEKKKKKEAEAERLAMIESTSKGSESKFGEDSMIQQFQSSTSITASDSAPASSTPFVSDTESTADNPELKTEPQLVEVKVTKKINWTKEFSELFNRMAGLRKLERKRPSTAAFGNWGITSQVNWLSSDSMGLMDLRCSMFMGKRIRGSKVRCPLSSMDREEDIYMQWLQLRAMFTRNDTILLSHHKNHYALIYAIREWTETTADTPENSTEDANLKPTSIDKHASNQRHVRQVLTARKGQRPSAWIDWKELRSTYIGWAGYKLMAIQRSSKRPTEHEWNTYYNEVLQANGAQNGSHADEAEKENGMHSHK
eukprot:g9634.t1